jgi:inosine-uridine nucleoside N-ribohydrolase
VGTQAFPVFIDTDIGLGTPVADVDDAFAIALLLSADRRGECRVVGISATFGNVPLTEALLNASTLLHVLGRPDVPLLAGAEGPILQDLAKFREIQGRYGGLSHGSYRPFELQPSPVGDTVEFLTHLLKESDVPIHILTLGPLTDLALVLVNRPSLRKKIARIIMMGGSARSGGNITPCAELNVWADPEAAAVIFRTGVPVVMVGLDVTRRRPVTAADLDKWASAPTTPVLRYLAEGGLHWIRIRNQIYQENWFYLHDAIAAAYMFRPDLFSTVETHVTVALHGPARGQTIADLRANRDQPPNATLCVDLEAEEVFRFITTRISGEWGKV